METFEAITERHGVLRFRPDPVEPEKIEQVLRAAVAAPSAANTQPWEFVVVTDPQLTKRVAHYLMEAQMTYVLNGMLELPEEFTDKLMSLYTEFDNAPCFIVFCLNQRVDLASARWAQILRDWDMCAIGGAIANLMAMATDLGLGTRYFGGFVADNDAAPLKEMLGIPAHVEIVAATPLGYHDEPPKERPEQSLDVLVNYRRGDKYSLAGLLKGKLPFSTVTHFDRYDDKTPIREG
ncbi:MAG: hypothetical protein GYB64_05720 [Chloroflexi bacterium]|nr:hypothetical protein [Chloroflexota bacterium]